MGKCQVLREKDGKHGRESSVNRIDRKNYALMFGPTTGDAIRLADTELWAQIEHDYTVYGDECKFGGGKVIRDGMGQSSGATR